jgi:dTDP-4-dehydrorhamnose reductase
MKVLILGAKGVLGGQLIKVLVGWDRSDAGVTKGENLTLKIEGLRPEAIITYALDLANSVKSFLGNNLPYDIYQVANSGAASWYDFAN